MRIIAHIQTTYLFCINILERLETQNRLRTFEAYTELGRQRAYRPLLRRLSVQTPHVVTHVLVHWWWWMEKRVLREWRLAQPVWTTTRLGEAIGLRTTLEPLAVWRQRHARKSWSRTWVSPATSCSPTALARGLFTRLRGVRTHHRPPHVDRRKKLRSLLPFERYLSRDQRSNILHIQTRSRHPMRRPMG